MPSFLIYRVGADEIRTGDTSSAIAGIERCVELDSDGRTVLNLLLLSTDAFDDDPRALFDIPEMRSWCAKLFSEAPYLFVVLSQMSLQWFFACVAPIEVHERGATSTTYEYLQPAKEELFRRIEDAAVRYLGEVMSGPGEAREHVERTMAQLAAAVGPASS